MDKDILISLSSSEADFCGELHCQLASVIWKCKIQTALLISRAQWLTLFSSHMKEK